MVCKPTDCSTVDLKYKSLFFLGSRAVTMIKDQETCIEVDGMEIGTDLLSPIEVYQNTDPSSSFPNRSSVPLRPQPPPPSVRSRPILRRFTVFRSEFDDLVIYLLFTFLQVRSPCRSESPEFVTVVLGQRSSTPR